MKFLLGGRAMCNCVTVEEYLTSKDASNVEPQFSKPNYDVLNTFVLTARSVPTVRGQAY